MTLSTVLPFVSLYITMTAMMSSPHRCEGFALSGISSATITTTMPKTSDSALFIFGRKSGRSTQKQKGMDSTSTTITSDTPKVQLKIIPSSSVVAKKPPANRDIDKILDTVSFLPEGVTQPKVVSSSSLITEVEVVAAHKAWGEGLVTFAKAYEERGYNEAKKVAQRVLNAAYGYAKGIPVLFKPTLASGNQTLHLLTLWVVIPSTPTMLALLFGDGVR
jgi:hypothetical protein